MVPDIERNLYRPDAVQSFSWTLTPPAFDKVGDIEMHGHVSSVVLHQQVQAPVLGGKFKRLALMRTNRCKRRCTFDRGVLQLETDGGAKVLRKSPEGEVRLCRGVIQTKKIQLQGMLDGGSIGHLDLSSLFSRFQLAADTVLTTHETAYTLVFAGEIDRLG